MYHLHWNEVSTPLHNFYREKVKTQGIPAFAVLGYILLAAAIVYIMVSFMDNTAFMEVIATIGFW